MMCAWISVVATWVIVGILSFFMGCIFEYRGKEYDDCSFEDCGRVFILLVVFGLISPILVFIAHFDLKKILSRLIYNISNVGVKKKGCSE